MSRDEFLGYPVFHSPVPRTALFVRFAIFAFAMLLGCAAPPERPDPVPVPAEGLEIALRADPMLGAVHVTYRLHGNLPPRLRVAFPHRWAGRDGYFDDIANVRAYNGRGEQLDIQFDHRQIAAIAVDDADTITVSYSVRPRRGMLTHASRYRALFNGHRFFAPGHAVFAEPLDLGAAFNEEIVVHIADDPRAGPDDPWRVRSTIDLSQPQPWTDLQDAALFAGPLEHVVRERNGRQVALYIDDGLAAGSQALADLAQHVVDAQATLLGEPVAAHTTVIVLRREDDFDAVNGAGRTGGFVLELGAHIDTDREGLAELIAHENLHRLNGHQLRFAAHDEFPTLWFREGLTDYVSMRNAAEHGVIDRQRFFRFVGNAMANYLGNPAHDRSADALADSYWTHRDVRRLPYDKGALIALLIDHRLRAEASTDLEGFLAWLRDREDAHRIALSNAILLERLTQYSALDWDEFWEESVLGSDELAVFQHLNSIGLEVVERVIPAPYYGFRVSQTVDGAWSISHVDRGSPADQAGLREGVQLTGEPYMPTNVNARNATVHIRGASGPRTVHIPAGPGQRRTFALSARSDTYLSAFGLDER